MSSVTIRRGGATVALALALLVVVAAPSLAAVNFLVMASPNIGANHNSLHSVAVGSATRIFSVGEYYNGANDRALILAGNGTSWSASTAPQPAHAGHNVLNSVTTFTASNAWAVGTYSIGKSSFNLIERFSAGKWSLVPLGNAKGMTASEFNGVAAGSPSSVMAVGDEHGLHQKIRPMSALFNGKKWTYFAVPNPGRIGTSQFTATLASVAVVPGSAGKKFWAVGTYSDGRNTIPFFDLWNGKVWQQHKLTKSVQAFTHAPSPVSSVVSSVAVVTSTNAWAVGYYTDNHTPPTPSNNRTFTVHWNGSGWSMIASPDRVSDATPNELVGVAAAGPNRIYAVGRYFAGPRDQTMALWWDTALKPASWTKITSADNTTDHNEFEGISMLPGVGAVVVGTYFSGSSDRTLVETCSDC